MGNFCIRELMAGSMSGCHLDGAILGMNVQDTIDYDSGVNGYNGYLFYWCCASYVMYSNFSKYCRIFQRLLTAKKVTVANVI